MEWIIIVGIVVAVYIIVYKYEKKIDKIEKVLDDHNEKLEKHHEKLKKHDNHIEQMWVTIPKNKKQQ
jgi:uncharacterized membrane-anchored protein YhcB (DUF1043 family)